MAGTSSGFLHPCSMKTHRINRPLGISAWWSHVALTVGTVAVLAGCTPPSNSTPTPAPIAFESPGVVGGLEADVQFSKETYEPGEEISVLPIAMGLTESAWLGVVPSDTEHDSASAIEKASLNRRTLTERSKLFVVAPNEPGSYEVRLVDQAQNGKELAYRGFKVVSAPPVERASIKLAEGASIAPGGTLKVDFAVPLGFEKKAWIGIVPSQIEHGSAATNAAAELGREDLEGRAKGTVELVLPADSGSYDVRLNNGEKEVASLSTLVRAR